MNPSCTIASNPVSAFLFGQNLEHTRGCLYGGLSAQLLRNRKFAGKPSRTGVAADWEGFGRDVMFELLPEEPYTRHACRNGMPRDNECQSQYLQNLDPAGAAGIRQRGLTFGAGCTFRFRNAVRSKYAEPIPVRVRVTVSGVCVAEREFTASTGEWETLEFTFRNSVCGEGCDAKSDAVLELEIQGRHTLLVGMMSLLPEDHFHGMRRDVVENLRAIGTTLIRWPGGNFAGEYRWRDGLLDVDERAPLQAVTEIETQPYSHGFDNQEIGTDDVVALCREIGAEPFLTINPVWDSPEETAFWVEYCNGAPDSPGGKLRAERGFPEPFGVKYWSLGNEMGYSHMEGPHSSADYARLARRHAEAMKRVDDSITLFSSGPYPSEEWARGAADALADLVPVVSLHSYVAHGHHDYTTPERAAETFRFIVNASEWTKELIVQTRAQLDERLAISLDEWNIWYAWYRHTGIAGGIYAARFLHYLMDVGERYQIRYACYFQPVNEGAIRVGALHSELTAIGQAMALMKEHAAGRRMDWPGRPENVFATCHADGICYVTAFCAEPDGGEMVLELPFGGTVRNARSLSFSGLLPGDRFDENGYDVPEVTAEHCIFRLAPMTMIGVWLQTPHA